MKMLSDADVLLFPVLYQSCDVPALLRHRKYADFTQAFATGLFDLMEGIVPLNRLWTELAEAEQAHTVIVNELKAASPESDVKNMTIRLHELMVYALDTRYELEFRRQLATLPVGGIDFFAKVEALADLGLDVRSRTWNALVNMRAGMAHRYGGSYGDAMLLANMFASAELSAEENRARLDEALDRLQEIMKVITQRNYMARQIDGVSGSWRANSR